MEASNERIPASYLRRRVTAGPFVETAEPFCGYYPIEANDFDRALEIAKRCSAKFGGVEAPPIMPTPAVV